MKRLAARTGFTLLELIVVMAAIGLLAAAIAPSIVQRILDGRIEETRAEARILHEAMVGKAATRWRCSTGSRRGRRRCR